MTLTEQKSHKLALRTLDELLDSSINVPVSDVKFNGDNVSASLNINGESLLIDGIPSHTGMGFRTKIINLNRTQLQLIREGAFIIKELSLNEEHTLQVKTDRLIHIIGLKDAVSHSDVEVHQDNYYENSSDIMLREGMTFFFAYDLSDKINKENMDLSKYWISTAILRSF